MSDTRIHTTLQCFVDLNLETDENSQYFLRLPKVSFERRFYTAQEGSVLDIDVSLEYPSEAGQEEVEVGLVINNTSVDDFSTINATYPQTLIFSAGEQTKTLKFQINEDFIENEIESFDVILGFFTNTIPGQYITTTVNIIDLTNLREVSISSSGGAIITDDQSNQSLEFAVLEGSSKAITVSLDSPSVSGAESIGVQFTNISTNSSDHNSSGIASLSWAIGEQNKIISVNTNSDEDVEGDEFLEIKLINPINVNVVDFSEAKLKIIDAAPAARYATANFQGFYAQKGKSGPNVEARYIRRNATTDYQDNTWRMFIKFGEYIEQNYLTFNPPNTSQSAPVCGLGCISMYSPGTLPQFQEGNKIFFGKNPITEQYGYLRMRIKNRGTYPCNISGTTLAVNDSITVVIDTFDYKIKLPANDVLIPAGSTYQGSPISQNTLVECNYEFTFEVDYDGVGFILRNSDNYVSTNKEFNLGVHRFDTTYSSTDADTPSNFYNLVTGYSNVWPYWESNPTFMQGGIPFCLPPGNILNTAPEYPVNMTDLQDILVDGIMFLHQDYSNQNSTNTTKTQYISFTFLPNGGKASDNGCDSVDIEFGGWIYSPQLLTTSIPFVVV
jgi:hypothetical protein